MEYYLSFTMNTHDESNEYYAIYKYGRVPRKGLFDINDSVIQLKYHTWERE